MKLRRGLIIGVAIFLLPMLGFLSGCSTQNPYTGESELSKTAVGTGVGALGGALVGQMIGHDTASTLIGAGIGAAVGGVAGNYMDRQTAELRQYLQSSGVQVAREGNDIRLIMPGDITFENDRADIRSEFYNTLNAVAIVLKKFNKTNVKVVGYASSTGSAAHNQELSERRAQAVANYLASQGVNQNRLVSLGYGARFPVASNKTREGQAQNRRVEITIHQI
ncbi:MAG: OmpA family protein [Gammaproteobacteria bacterium]|nr:OmpA family protein [Gammaproteobacteria bacterium]